MHLERIADIINGVRKNGKLSLHESTELCKLPVIDIPSFVQNDDDKKWQSFMESTTEEQRETYQSRLPEEDVLIYTTRYPDVVCRLALVDQLWNVVITVYFDGNYYIKKSIKGGWVKTGKWVYTPLLSTKPVDDIPEQVSKLLDSLLTYAGINKLFGFNARAKRDTVSLKSVSGDRIDPESLISIVYLDKPPSEKSESNGGTHNSPISHGRRKHTRTLRHHRYRNHPMYLVPDGIDVGSSWVGESMFTHKKIVYTLRGTYG